MSLIEKGIGLFWQNTKKQDDKRIATLSWPEGVCEKRDLFYLEDGHRHHCLDVYYPEGHSQKLPVIIDIHGGGWAYGDKELNKNYCLHLAKRGYTVFNISYRLYPEVRVKQQLEDIGAAMRWIKENLQSFPCDEKRIYLTGDSAGGMLACFTAMLSQSSELRYIYDIEHFGLTFNAIALTSPMLYMDGEGLTNYYTRIMLGKGYKSEKWGSYVNLDKILPLGKLPPVFLLTSTGDTLAREQTLMGAKELRERGVACQLMDFLPFEGSDLPHVFPVLYPEKEASCRAIDEMLHFFSLYGG